MAGEQRKRRRFGVTLPVTIRSRGPAVERPIQTSTRDISSAGIYFSMSGQMEIGSDLEWEITLPEEFSGGTLVRLRCRGKIVRVERPDSAGRIGVAACLENYKFIKEELVTTVARA